MKISVRKFRLMQMGDRRDARNAICIAGNRGLTPFYKRLSIKEEVIARIRAAHDSSHDLEIIKWNSLTSVY